MARQPHIVIFNPDQWRWDVMGHMGNPAAVTPNLDRLVATEAVSFRNAFCQNTVCTPSRCSFMTGWYPHVRGHRTMHHALHTERGEPVLLKKLKDNGYRVWWGGKNDLVPHQDGYEQFADVHYFPKPPKPLWGAQRGEKGSKHYYSFYRGRLDTQGEPFYHDNDWMWVLGAIDYIKNAPKDKPLCLYLPLIYPHPPYAVEEPWYSMIDRAKLPPRIAEVDWSGKPSILRGIREMQKLHDFTEAEWTELRAVYYGMCARLDHQFAMLMDALREAGMYDDTAVFLFADHGDFTGDYGLVEKTQNTFEDVLSRVPLIVKPPKGVPVAPRVSDAMTELIDFTATVYELTGIDPGYTHFGRSLLPVLAGEEELRDATFCEGGRRKGEMHCSEKQSTAWMADPSVSEYWPRLKWQQQEGPEHGKATMCRTKDYKYVRRLYEKDELYDLRSDPGERANRIDDPSLAGVLAQLKDRLLTHYQDTCDVVPWDCDQRG